MSVVHPPKEAAGPTKGSTGEGAGYAWRMALPAVKTYAGKCQHHLDVACGGILGIMLRSTADDLHCTPAAGAAATP